jgi:hypothetical protein
MLQFLVLWFVAAVATQVAAIYFSVGISPILILAASFMIAYLFGSPTLGGLVRTKHSLERTHRDLKKQSPDDD